jgi:hypothetical protein
MGLSLVSNKIITYRKIWVESIWWSLLLYHQVKWHKFRGEKLILQLILMSLSVAIIFQVTKFVKASVNLVHAYQRSTN